MLRKRESLRSQACRVGVRISCTNNVWKQILAVSLRTNPWERTSTPTGGPVAMWRRPRLVPTQGIGDPCLRSIVGMCLKEFLTRGGSLGRPQSGPQNQSNP